MLLRILDILGLSDNGLRYERRRAEFERKIGALMHPVTGVTVVWLWLVGVYFERFNFFLSSVSVVILKFIFLIFSISTVYVLCVSLLQIKMCIIL